MEELGHYPEHQSIYPVEFTADTTIGSGRGTILGYPTINLQIVSVPKLLPHGMFSCIVHIEDECLQGVMHYGERPTFSDSLSCEIHVLDKTLPESPDNITVIALHKLRDVQHFSSKEELIAQIEKDIVSTRAILNSYASEDKS